MKKDNILGVNVNVITMDETINFLHRAINNNRTTVFSCANPHAIVISTEDMEFKKALNDVDILLPDGIGVVLGSKILGGDIKEKVSGPDVFFEFTKFLNKSGTWKYFFYGSTNDTLRKIELVIKRDFPNIKIAGLYSSPFRDITEEENNNAINIINESGTDVLWVGMTAPKQEKWLYKNKDKLNVKIIGAIGAAFDFFAGTKKRSPYVFRKLGLEWLLRFMMEPKRLWKRNFVSAPKFLFLITKTKILDLK